MSWSGAGGGGISPSSTRGSVELKEAMGRLYSSQDLQKQKAENAALPVLQNTQPNATQPLGTNRNITIA